MNLRTRSIKERIVVLLEGEPLRKSQEADRISARYKLDFQFAMAGVDAELPEQRIVEISRVGLKEGWEPWQIAFRLKRGRYPTKTEIEEEEKRSRKLIEEAYSKPPRSTENDDEPFGD